MAQVEFGICRPTGIQPRKESGPDLILMSIGAAIFLIAFALLRRSLRVAEPSSSLPLLALVSLAGLALSAWSVSRMWRRQDDAALMEAGFLGFIFLINANEKLPKGSALAFAAALLPLAPAALFAW